MRNTFLCLALLAGCGSDGNAGAVDAAMPAPDLARPIGMDQTVKILSGAVHLGGMLQNDAEAMLPSGLFSKITLHIDLTCPAAGCDPYDRIARVLVWTGGIDTGGYHEIGRYITPFGVRGKWDIDVTDLAPILTGGNKMFRSYLETYAPNGQGWIVTASLVYVGGVPDPEPVAVLPLLGWDSLTVGDPASQPVDKSLWPQTVSLPAGATRARVRLFVTGHGQGNSDNCAEFCDLTHTLLVDGKPADTRSIWRDDCDQNPIHQNGSWKFPREGWCPGSGVKPWNVDLGARSMPFTLTYGAPTVDDGSGLLPYVNTCAPKMCDPKSCPFGGADPCAYNGGSHTDPRFVISAAVIFQR